MKTLLLFVMAGLTFSLTSCDDDKKKAVYYDPDSDPLGRPFDAWIADWWQYLMSHDCATLPTAGANPQSGNVHFISGQIGTYTLDVTVREGQSILTPVINYINDYPCPDPAFQPAAGQSLEAFLQEGAAALIDMVEGIEVTLNGEIIPVNDDFRYLTGQFTITGHPDIPNCLDPCVTGEPQVAASDGYWVFLRPLDVGLHELVIKGSIPAYDLVLDGTIHITVE